MARSKAQTRKLVGPVTTADLQAMKFIMDLVAAGRSVDFIRENTTGGCEAIEEGNWFSHLSNRGFFTWKGWSHQPARIVLHPTIKSVLDAV
jgi:hypothetical protein